MSYICVCMVIKNRDVDIHKTFYDICIIHFMETYQLRWLATYIVVFVLVSHVHYHIFKSSGSYKNTKHDKNTKSHTGLIRGLSGMLHSIDYFIYYTRTSVCMYMSCSLTFFAQVIFVVQGFIHSNTSSAYCVSVPIAST
jgi:hypothetical protein